LEDLTTDVPFRYHAMWKRVKAIMHVAVGDFKISTIVGSSELLYNTVFKSLNHFCIVQHARDQNKYCSH